MPVPPLRFVTFLAPNMLPVYKFIARFLSERMGLPAEFQVGFTYTQLYDEVDVGFVCGLPYIQLTRQGEPPVEPLAAPVLKGDRYGGQPIYFSDVVVRRDSPFRSFAELRGRSWCYNETQSQSGYGITRYHLLQLGETSGFFREVVETGWHERSLRLVCSGEVDASAIDSQVLAIALRDQPELAAKLRILDSLGPSTIQPVVASRRLSPSLRAELQAVLVEMHRHDLARESLAHGFVERFVPVADGDYDDIREMQSATEAASTAFGGEKRGHSIFP
jgi:phosphonate transport system substrate-binding protein